MEMTWEQKREALEALCGLRLGAHWDGAYTVHGPIEVAYRGCLTSVSGIGATVGEAVHDFWQGVTEIPDDAHICVRTPWKFPDVQRVRWNGYMWEPYVRPSVWDVAVER